MQIIAAHKDFHAAQCDFALETEGSADFFLVGESQLVVVFAAGKMQLVAHAKKKILRLLELGDVTGTHNAAQGQRVKVLGIDLDPGDPAGRVDVPQTSFTLLHLGFEQIHRPAVALVAQTAFLLLVLNKSSHPSLDQLFFQYLFKVTVKRKIPAQKTRIQDRRLDLQVGTEETDRLSDGSDGAADLQSRVPECVKDWFRDRIEKQQIDVRLGVELAAPEAALGDHRAARRLAGKAAAEIIACSRINVAHQMVHDRRVSRDDLHPATAASMFFQQKLPCLLNVAARQPDQVGVLLRFF